MSVTDGGAGQNIRWVVPGSRLFKTPFSRQLRCEESCTVSMPRAKAAPLQGLYLSRYSPFNAIRTIVWFSPCDAISISAFLPEPVTNGVWALPLLAVTI
jgi:hypothetical protein